MARFKSFINNRWFIIVLLCLTYSVRISFFAVRGFKFSEISEDSKVYLKYAENLSNHLIFSDSENPPIVPTANRTPIFPLFIALTTSIWGFPIESIAFFLMFVDFLSAVVIFLLCIEMFKSIKIAKISALLYALCPAVGLYSTVILGTTLGILFTICSLFFLIKFLNHHYKWKFLILCCLFLALLSLTKPNYALLPLVFAFLLFFKISNLKKKIVFSLVLIFLYGIFITPWIIRNIIVTKSFVTLSKVDAGYDYLISKEREPYRLWLTTWLYWGKDFQFMWRISHSVGRHISTVDYAFADNKEKELILSIVSSYEKTGKFSEEHKELLTQISLEKIKKSPFTYYFLLPMKRSIYLWKSRHVAQLKTGSYISRLMGLVNLMFYFGFVIGLLFFWQRIPHISLLLGLLCYSTFFHGFFNINNILAIDPRYTIQSFPVLIIFSGLFLYRITTKKVALEF